MNEDKQKLIEITETTTIADNDEFYLSRNNIDYRASWGTMRSGVGLTELEILVRDTDLTIPDNFQYNTIVANPNTTNQYGTLAITAPAGSNNIGRKYRIEHGISDGVVKIDAGTSQNFFYKYNSIQYIYLFYPGNFIEFYWNENLSKWSILQMYSEISSAKLVNDEFIQSGTGVNRYYGLSNFDYNTKSAAIDLTGQVITEATSNNTWIVLDDTGGTGASGTYVAYGAVGGGIATAARTITASDSTTSVVASGNLSDNNNILHNMGVPLGAYESEILFSTTGDGTGGTTMRIMNGVAVENGSSIVGMTAWQVDLNSCRLTTTLMRYILFNASGNDNITNEYYNSILRFKI